MRCHVMIDTPASCSLLILELLILTQEDLLLLLELVKRVLEFIPEVGEVITIEVPLRSLFFKLEDE